jgi:AcrR family transcriptional regulator
MKKKPPKKEVKRPYELGKRLDQMDQSRATILRAAQAQLEAEGYRRMSMASLAAESGVTRQTVHNLYGTKSAIVEALFDLIALDGGMESMYRVMAQSQAERMLEGLVKTFCGFWASNRLLIRRIHGIGAIDPEFGTVIAARNQRRLVAASRIVRATGDHHDVQQRAAILAALTSFEFFDGLAENSVDQTTIETNILELARKMLYSGSDNHPK